MHVSADGYGYGYRYILMERVDGGNLELAWHQLDDKERDAVAEQLQDYVAQLRALTPLHGPRICAVNGRLRRP